MILLGKTAEVHAGVRVWGCMCGRGAAGVRAAWSVRARRAAVVGVVDKPVWPKGAVGNLSELLLILWPAAGCPQLSNSKCIIIMNSG